MRLFANTYLLGVATKGNFENVQVTDAATEANIIKSNGTYIAVSKKSCDISKDPLEQQGWWRDLRHEGIRLQETRG